MAVLFRFLCTFCIYLSPRLKIRKTNKAWQQTKLIKAIKQHSENHERKIKVGSMSNEHIKEGHYFRILPLFQHKMSLWTNPKKRKLEENIAKGTTDPNPLTLSALSQSMSLKIFSFVAFGKQQDIHVTTFINPCFNNFDDSNNSIPHYSKSWSNFSLVLLS